MKISFSRLRFYLSWFLISTLISFISYANDYSDESQINVSKSDFNNLWSIAIELKSELNNVSVYQIMMAFQDLNETSFDRNNINYLKVNLKIQKIKVNKKYVEPYHNKVKIQ